MITVKLIKVPGTITEVALEDGATVADALTAGGQEVGDGQEVTVNGNSANSTTSLNDGDRIVIAKGAKGA